MKKESEYLKSLKRRLIALTLASSLLLTGCGTSKKNNDDDDNDFERHNHYVIEYGDVSFLIRECENDILVFDHNSTKGNGLILVGCYYNKLESADYTRAIIHSEEEEEYYRSIEEKQIEDGKMLVYNLK